jgi:hypothetical protein
MSRKSIVGALNKLKHLELLWDSFSTAPDQSGETVYTLQLTNPIPYVRGTQDLVIGDRTVPVDKSDVTEVKIHHSTIEALEKKYNAEYDRLVDEGKQEEADKLEPEMYFDEDKSGGFAGSSLMLDVAKRNREVWMILPEKNYRAMGNEYSRTRRNSALDELYGLKGGVSSAKVSV